jgi:phosphatidylserine decarboxylase
MGDDYGWSEARSRTAFPVARAGYAFIGGAAFATLVFALLGLTPIALIGLFATFAICGFFRDPDRVVPNRPGGIVSPADGRIVAAGTAAGSPFFEGDVLKISIFMSVFNVHVNRMPAAGRVQRVLYRPGRFLKADRSEASLSNEHNAVFLETEDGRSLCVVQVAGWIARRIICGIQAGDRVLRGQRFGMICFGSRLDVYLPKDAVLKVAVGDTVKAGTSILGSFPIAETPT